MKCHYLGYAGRQVTENRALLCYYAMCSGNFLLIWDNLLVPFLWGQESKNCCSHDTSMIPNNMWNNLKASAVKYDERKVIKLYT